MTVLNNFTLTRMTKIKKIGNPRSWQGCRLYQFPIAAVTNCHTLSGLKQHILLNYRFWQSKLPKSRCWKGHIPSGGSTRECITLPFPTSGHHLLSLVHSLVLHFQSQHCGICFFSLTLPSVSAFIIIFPFMTLTLLPPYNKNPMITLDALNNLG